MWVSAMSVQFPNAKEMAILSTDFKENYANEIMAYSIVAALIKEAATKGYDGVRIAQDLPLTLEDCKAAKGLLKQIEKQGYRFLWIDAASGMEGFAADVKKANQYKELQIIWNFGGGNILHKVELPEEAKTE